MDMTIAEIVKLAVDNGLTVILMGYFLVKDWMFNNKFLLVLDEIKQVLAELKAWHSIEEVEK